MALILWTLDVLIPAITAATILLAILAHVYLQQIWIFDPR